MKKLTAVVLGTLLLAACGGDAGKEYLGKWQRVNFKNQTVQIDRNGDNFIFRETSPSMLNGEMRTQNLAAVLKDGTMQVSGQMTISLVIDKSTGHLTGPNADYVKVD